MFKILANVIGAALIAFWALTGYTYTENAQSAIHQILASLETIKVLLMLGVLAVVNKTTVKKD